MSRFLIAAVTVVLLALGAGACGGETVPEFTEEQIERAVSAIETTEGVRNAGIRQDGRTVVLITFVDSFTTRTEAAVLATNAIRNAMLWGPEQHRGLEITRGIYDYESVVFYTDNTILLVGLKFHNRSDIEWVQ